MSEQSILKKKNSQPNLTEAPSTGFYKRGWCIGLGCLAFMVAIAAVSFMESYMTFLGKRIIDEGIIPRDFDALTSIAIEYGLLLIVFAAFVWLFIFTAGTLGHRVQYDLRKQMFERIQQLELGYFDRTPTGWLMSRATSDASRVGDLVSWGFLDITWTIMSVASPRSCSCS